MNIEELYSFEHVYKSAKKCTKGVRWKTSTQNFECLLMSNAENLREEVINGSYRSRGFHEFTLRERGKIREIKAVHISERMIQKTLCDYFLIPKFTSKFIYDNGACLKGKGTHFSIKRLRIHLHNYWINHGNTGYILQFDISNFFNSIDHEILINKVSKYIKDNSILNLYTHLVKCFGNGVGLGLGSQISQVIASIYLNELDHLIKDKLRFKYYGRYMDDGYIICESKERLQNCLAQIEILFNKLKLKLNRKKTHIIPIKHGFTFLKRNMKLYPNGKIVMKPYKKNILRYRRKYKKLALKENADESILNNLQQTFIGYLKEFNYLDIYTWRIKEYVQFKKNCGKPIRKSCKRRYLCEEFESLHKGLVFI